MHLSPFCKLGCLSLGLALSTEFVYYVAAESQICAFLQIKPLVSEGYRVIVPDLRGFGESDAPTETSAYAMKNGISDMIALLDQMKINKRASYNSYYLKQ